MGSVSQVMSSPYAQIALLLALSLLMGLEREEHKLEPGVHIAAGVRTFPLLALLGYMLVILSPDNILPAAVGLVAAASFLVVSYQHKQAQGTRGFTSEAAALVAYVMGALIARNEYWIATTIAVADVLLLSGKPALQGLAQRLDRDELVTCGKFLLLSAVILPIVPNQSFTQFNINPFRIWLVVVVVSAMSYGSYLLQRTTKSAQSAVLSAILGGAYSSTMATVTLARRSKGQNQPGLYAGSIVLASAVMFLRMGVLITIINPALGVRVIGGMSSLALLTAAAGVAIMLWRREADAAPMEGGTIGGNPLELRTALLFAGLFVLLSVATRLAAQYLGNTGVFTLAAVTGVTDVDPFVMGVAQSAGTGTAMGTAALAVIIAASGNNIAKGFYAVALGGRRVGLPVLVALTAVGVVGVAAFAYLHLA